jgi:hypothetical protein
MDSTSVGQGHPFALVWSFCVRWWSQLAEHTLHRGPIHHGFTILEVPLEIFA